MNSTATSIRETISPQARNMLPSAIVGSSNSGVRSRHQERSAKTPLRSVGDSGTKPGKRAGSGQDAKTFVDAKPEYPVELEAIVASSKVVDCDMGDVCGLYTPYCCGVSLLHVDELHELIGLYALVKGIPESEKDQLISCARRQALVSVPDAITWFQHEIDTALELKLAKPVTELAERCRRGKREEIWLGLDIDLQKHYALKVKSTSLPSDEDCRAVEGLDVMVLFKGFTTKYRKLRRLCGSLYQAQPRRLQVVDVDAQQIAFLKLANPGRICQRQCDVL